jgi:hypothetical protein
VWGSDNSLDQSVKAQVTATFHWTPDEVAVLLGAIDLENGVARGSVGQCVYMLLVADPGIDATLPAGIGRALDRSQPDAAGWGVCLATYWAGREGHVVLSDLLRRRPELQAISLVREVQAAVLQFGYISLE